MCNIIMTEEGDVSTLAEMEERGWIIIEEEDYPETIISPEKRKYSCLCGVDVEKILDRNNLDWTSDPFGWCIAPLEGKW